jgi:hypothetical protein
MPKQSLNAFCCEVETDIQAFRSYWSAAHAADPEKFPAEMNLGDWDEQFHLWLEGNTV